MLKKKYHIKIQNEDSVKKSLIEHCKLKKYVPTMKHYRRHLGYIS